jgi:hypothetical protein
MALVVYGIVQRNDLLTKQSLRPQWMHGPNILKRAGRA